jgi:VanZ family protein
MKRGARFFLLVVWIAFIIFLTGYPLLPTPKIREFPVDKIAHFVLFFLFGLFARPLLKPLIYFLFGTALILVAEFQQLFIPGRTFEILDMMAGALGLIVYYIITLPKRSTENGLSKT